MEINNIPVFVDDVKGRGANSMVRCTYFSIECDTPSPNWYLNLGANTAPFLMLGLSGIITGAIGGEPFRNSNDIDTLIRMVEEHPGLFVDTNPVWLPGFVLTGPERGAIYRVAPELFNEAFQYTLHRSDEEKFRYLCREKRWDFLRSPEEEEAFEEWERRLIDHAKVQYHEKNKQFRLDKLMMMEGEADA